MTDYTKSTNFATKDNLSSGNPLKIVKGTEIDTEFNNIATAISTKADLASPTFTGTVVIPTATISTANISAGTITGITDLAIADGGTGASTAANARTNLGLVIGTNVQAWDADLDTWATKTAPSGTVVGTTDTQTLTNKTLTSPNIGGTPVMNGSVVSSGTAVASTSGTSIDFTSLPAWCKRVTVMFNGVSLNGTSNILVQLGTSSGFENSGYQGASLYLTSGVAGNAANSAGFIVNVVSTSTQVTSGNLIINLLNNATYTWSASGVFGSTGTNTAITLAGGAKSLSGVLDRVRITTVNGSDTFDAGSVNILFE